MQRSVMLLVLLKGEQKTLQSQLAYKNAHYLTHTQTHTPCPLASKQSTVPPTKNSNILEVMKKLLISTIQKLQGLQVLGSF